MLETGSGLEIRVLGPLEVLVDGAPARVDTRKALAILVLLAVEGRPYAREELAAIMWPDSDDESARGALRRTLSVLRGALGDRWLHIDRSSAALVPGDDVTIDLARLEAAEATGSLAELAKAADLARGPFLAGFALRDSPDFDDWRATRAASIERRVASVLDRLTTLAGSAGDATTQVAAAERLVELDPLDERARRRLMVALAERGDRAGAIREYRATVAVLERELGVAPLPETTELYEAIRDSRVGPVPGTITTEAGPLPAASRHDQRAEAGPTVDPGRVPVQLPMLGRRRELDSLRAAVGAAAPDGRIAVVVGEAGIGKSRLLEEAAATAAANGSIVLAARAFPAEGSIAYAPVVELLRAGLGRGVAAEGLAAVAPAAIAEIGRLMPLPRGLDHHVATPGDAGSPAARTRLLEAIADVLTALASGDRPGVLVVEDLQWADDASREALLYLARRLTGRSLRLLLSWRREDLDDAGSAFAGAISALRETMTIQLGRLDDVVVAALVAAAIERGLPAWDASLLAAQSEGLPLYVVEALRSGPSGDGRAPRGVEALLRERLGSVSQTATQVLVTAAVIGSTFDLATVRAASGRSDDETVAALEELIRRGIIREVERGGAPVFDFGHDRLRDAAYEDTGLARRRLLHRRVADVLRGGGVVDQPARLAQIAGHERAAGRDAAAAEAYRDAGLGFRRVHANREALSQLETALALGHPDVVGLQVAIAEVRTALGDYSGAITSLESAAALADGATLPGIELRLGRVHARRGDVGPAASHLDAALGSLASPEDRTAGLVERGAVALRAGDLEQAASLAVDAVALAASRGDRRAQGAAARLAGLVAQRRGDLAAARDNLSRSVAIAAETVAQDPGPLIAARNALALVEAEAGRRDAAIELLEAALGDARRAGELHLEAAVENNLADQLHASGRRDEAMFHLKRAVSLFAEVGGRPEELEPGIWQLVTW